MTPQPVIEKSHSPLMRDVLKAAEHVAETDLSVVIVGETGTGKEWLARRIHLLSRRAGQKFIEFHSEALRSNRLEAELFGTESHPKYSGNNGGGADPRSSKSKTISSAPVESTDGPMLQPVQAGPTIRTGVMERVGTGTLFFRRLSEMPLTMQERTAEALLTKQFERLGGEAPLALGARVIATLLRDPQILAREGSLSGSIVRALSAVLIHVPPLRDRREDIPSLIDRFIFECNGLHGTRAKGINLDALRLCARHTWPGNVRELRNAIRYAAMLSFDQFVQPIHLPAYLRDHELPHIAKVPALTPNLTTVAEAEKRLIERTLNLVVTKREAAEILGISVKTLYNKINKYFLHDRFIGSSRRKTLQPQGADDSE